MFHSPNQELLQVGTYLINKSTLIGKGASANVYKGTLFHIYSHQSRHWTKCSC